MKLFRLNEKHLQPVRSNPFKTEKELQQLVESNVKELFDLEFVKSELAIKNFRLDSLCYDRENNAFVIIEYKNDRNFSVIDQGYTYLSLLLNNKSDFILEYNERMEGILRRDDVDWTQSRIIFISPHFTEYQKHSINFKDVPFELWEIKRYEDGHISFNQHRNSSNVSITTTSTDKDSVVSKVSSEVKVYTEDFHLFERGDRLPYVIDQYKALRERILTLGDDVEIIPKGNYIGFKRKEHFADIVIYNSGFYIVLNMKKGELKDPNGIADAYADNTRHWGKGDYSVSLKENIDIDYVMYLIKQSYQNQDK